MAIIGAVHETQVGSDICERKPWIPFIEYAFYFVQYALYFVQ